MTVKSREGEGSEFTFVIPYRRGEAADELQPVSADEEKKLITGKVLLCEDNELNQRLIEAILTEKGYRIDIAGNGVTGIELFKKNEYDIVLMDLQMPRQDGRETTRIIRQELKSPVPVIALTANFLNTEREKCLQDGMNDYLSKPFKKSDLFEMISRWIGKYKEENRAGREPDGGKPVISLEHLEEMSAGNKEFQQQMVSLFIENSEKSLQQMQLHFEEEDFRKINLEAHKLKGSFGVIGADVNLLQQLETAGTAVEVKEHLLALEKQLAEIFTTLKN